MKKGLFIFVGESFRTGGQGSRIKGLSESYDDQKLASESHVKIIERVSEDHGVDPEIKILTYTTQYIQDLAKWYDRLNTNIYVYPDVIGYANLFSEAVSRIEEEYEFIFFIRIDLILKSDFTKLIKKNKINYSMVCFLYNNFHKIGYLHRVADLMLYIPSEFITNLKSGEILLNHDSIMFLGEKCRNSVDFILDTYHDSDSHKDRNPIYRIAGRPEADSWYSLGYRLGPDPIQDESKTYEEVFKNEYTL